MPGEAGAEAGTAATRAVRSGMGGGARKERGQRGGEAREGRRNDYWRCQRHADVTIARCGRYRTHTHRPRCTTEELMLVLGVLWRRPGEHIVVQLISIGSADAPLRDAELRGSLRLKVRDAEAY